MSAGTPFGTCHALIADERVVDHAMTFAELRAASSEVRMAWVHIMVHWLLEREHEYVALGQKAPDVLYTTVIAALCHVACPTTGVLPTDGAAQGCSSRPQTPSSAAGPAAQS